ncbi:mitochondrial protein from FMP27-domain-containing protein [Sordaria brevicollis]|uniref:Mitochondrial protein from FMP27-domain-containing protein n=1 Tax=Sordaria brevicollis TaxID=83679 RepID=A0AAE0PGD1_SORBR|nr:mitochondrial protein from FMP27-domain-containing protein [Sordaria brevicollis]
MALLNPTFIFGIFVLLYLSSFIIFAVVRILTGLSIQRIGYFSLRRLAYTPKDGIKIEIRGLGLNVHRPTFAQPTWLSIVVDELAVTVDVKEVERSKSKHVTAKTEGDTLTNKEAGEKGETEPLLSTPPKVPAIKCDTSAEGRGKTWKQLTKLKEKIKKLHRSLDYLRMVDIVATSSTLTVADVGSVQIGSFTLAVDTRDKMVDRARFFLQSRSDQPGEQRQAEWIITLRSVLFTVHGRQATEILDSASFNVHGFLYGTQDGLRDAAVGLKLGRLHIPYDDVRRSALLYKKIKELAEQVVGVEPEPLDEFVDKVMQEIDVPGRTNRELMQTVSDSKELVSSVLRGVKEVQFAVSFIGLTKKIESVKAGGAPVVLNASMKEVGIDLHRLDPKSPAHRMYFPSKDIAHEALAAALSISVGIDDGQGKPERLMYIPMATTTVRTTLPSKTVELAEEGTAEERNANMLFANSVVTSPSVDLNPRHLPLLLAMLRPKPKKKTETRQPHVLISRLLPKANIKFSMHEPVLRITLPPVEKGIGPDEFDLLISSISSVSLDLESYHSAVEELHYSLAASMRIQTHNLYYQTSSGERFDLLITEAFDLKVQLNATPDVHVVAQGNLQTFALKLVREEIGDGLRHIVRQLRPDVKPDKLAMPKRSAKKSNFLRGMPAWLLQFQFTCSEFSLAVAGVDKEITDDARGVAIELENWSVDYRAQRLDGLQRRTSRRRASSRSLISSEVELMKSAPTSPRKKHHHEGDGRRVAVQVRGLEVFMVELDEIGSDPFLSMPKLDLAFSTLSDNQGPLFHVQANMKKLLLQYSLYRHYAVALAVSVLLKAFGRPAKPAAAEPTTPTDASPRKVVGLLSPLSAGSGLDSLIVDEESTAAREFVTVDAKVTFIQVKADLPSDPPLMAHIYALQAGRQRWSAPFCQAKLIRLYAEAPRMRKVWARVVSIKDGRVDYRESKRKFSNGSVHDERMVDIGMETIRVAVPHEMIGHKITDNVVNVIKSVKQLHHRFKTGTNEYILDKGPEGPKTVPKVSLRARTLLFDLEDGAFEWKLGMIYRAARVEQKQRQAREEAFRIKVKKIHEEATRDSSKLRTRSAAPRGRDTIGGSNHVRSHSNDSLHQPGIDPHFRGRVPRYDPDGRRLNITGNTEISIGQARHNLHLHNARSWKRRIDRQYAAARNEVKDLQRDYWGGDETIPDDLDEGENILEVPLRHALMSAVVNELQFVIDKPSFPLRDLPDYLHKVGKGMPKDMEYTLLVPLGVQLSMGEAKVTLRDYPLPFIHVPPIKPNQSARLPALVLRTDFVIAEEFRGVESTRKIRVQVIPPQSRDPSAPNKGSFAIDVSRTIGPVKMFSDIKIDIHTANPTRITWGPSYQPAVQDMMMAIESLTKPQLDPSERVGFWDKIRLSFHSRFRVSWKGDGDVHLALKGSRDPYEVTGDGAGFLMCWRSDVRFNINVDDDPKKFMTVDSGEYVLAVPDYSHQVREGRRHRGENESIASESSHKSTASFKKVVMKLSGKVQWLAGLIFEQAIENGKRNFEFKPHYEVVLKSPQYAKPQNGLPYDAFRGFRSQHIHLSVAIRAPVDREWTATNPPPSRSYNAVHLTPRFFTHFFSWLALFSGPLSLPVRQGPLWPNREKNSKKFGRHLATIKYNIMFAPLFLSHIYKHKDVEDYSENAVSATGIKVRLDSFMLDLHQRREEFNTRDRGRGTQTRISSMKLHAGQLDLVSADIRAVSASIRGTTADAFLKHSLSTFVTDQEEDGTDLSRFTIPDNDLTWIDMDDFVELDWILPTEPNPDTKILPLAFAPRITYFRQTDIGGVIDGDPDRSSPFGHEPTHSCIMSQDDDPRRIQAQLIRQRLKQLDKQMETHNRNLGEIELRMVRDEDPDIKADFEALTRHTTVLAEKKIFLEGMLREMTQTSHCYTESADSSSSKSDWRKSKADINGSMSTPAEAEFASDFKNRFVVHNLQLKWNNTLRNIILRYIHQVGQRRGFVYYMSRPAVKFILDIVEEQNKNKAAKESNPTPSASSPNVNGTERETQADIEDRIRKIMEDGKKFASAEDAGPGNPSMADLTSGIAKEYMAQSSYHIRVIAPQIQLQSDKNKKHVVLIAAKGMELKVVDVMDQSRLFDTVSGLVQRRFLVNMDSTQFFVTHQKWFSTQLVSMYSGNTYGTPAGSSWPPWVPMEVMFDFEADPFGFKRVVKKTSAMLRYDKYNTLRLKYNDEVNASDETDNGEEAPADNTESRMDNLWIEFPQAHALCNSSQYYAFYVIVVDLLMYSEPLEKTRSERLEKIMLASDFSDLRGAPEMVIKLQERVRQLEDIKTHFQTHGKYMDKRGWKDRLVLERDLAACEDELFFMMKAITSSQRKYDSSTSSALLKWSISAKEIVWHLIRDTSEPLVELQLKNVEYDRTDNSDGSHVNLIQVGSILGLNLLPDAIYPVMVAPYVDGNRGGFDPTSQPMIRVYFHMLEAIAGIPVMDHFEVNLFPLKIQLEREVGKKLFEYVFPGIDGDDATAAKNTSPFLIKQTLPEDDEDADDDQSLETVGIADSDREAGSFSTRPGSLELRLRPTLTSDPEATPTKNNKALSIHTGEGSSFRLFRSVGTGFKTVSKKPSSEDTSLRPSTPRPGVGRTSTGLSSKDGSSNPDTKKGTRFMLRKAATDLEKRKKSDDLTKMIDRASNYMTFAYIKMPSVVLCLSYKGKGDRNLEDVHNFVFRLPTIEYQNKTWSNLDLALNLKNRIIKALISHTGAIIGNKFSKHRPNTAQQSKLRELATSSVLLAPMLSESRDNSGDDSSSIYNASIVDFSRSPPRSIARSQTVSVVPSSESRSSSIASSQRSPLVPQTTATVGTSSSAQSIASGPPAVGFTMTPPTPILPPGADGNPSHRGAFSLLRPATSASSRLFGGSGSGPSSASPASSGSGELGETISRPGTSSGVSMLRQSNTVLRDDKESPEATQRKAGYLRDKLSAISNRLKDRSGGGSGVSGPTSAPRLNNSDRILQQVAEEAEASERSGGSGSDDVENRRPVTAHAAVGPTRPSSSGGEGGIGGSGGGPRPDLVGHRLSRSFSARVNS